MAMRTSHSERRALRGMARELRSSDPGLVGLFGQFTRLTRREDLPRTERLRTARWPGEYGSRLRTISCLTLFMLSMAAALAFVIGSAGEGHGYRPAAPGRHLSCLGLYEWERYQAQARWELSPTDSAKATGAEATGAETTGAAATGAC
jgi:hypothetical protein